MAATVAVVTPPVPTRTAAAVMAVVATAVEDGNCSRVGLFGAHILDLLRSLLVFAHHPKCTIDM